MKVELSKSTKDYKVEQLENYDHQLKYDLMTVVEHSINFNHVLSCEMGKEAWNLLKTSMKK